MREDMLLLYVFLCTLCSGCMASEDPMRQCGHTGGVSKFLQTEERLDQDLLACSGPYTASVRNFNSEIKTRLVSRNYFGVANSFANVNYRCRNACPDSEITWCVYMYHPTRDIKICMNQHGVIDSNTTEYAWLLQLQCYFNVDPDTGNIQLRYAESFLNRVLMVCTSESSTCSEVSSTELIYIDTGRERFDVSIVNGTSSHLILGRTNVFLCVAEFHASFLRRNSQWYINGKPIQFINEEPFCDNVDCNRDTLATTRNQRIRSYATSISYSSQCSPSVHIRSVWLWIDNAMELDARTNFTCRATSPNRFQHQAKTVIKTDTLKLIPVNSCPIMDVVTVKVPNLNSSASNGSEGLLQLGDNNGSTVVEVCNTATFQWECSVQASSGDTLAWQRDGDSLPVMTSQRENAPCSGVDPNSVFVMKSPDEPLPECQRLLKLTLVACAMSPQKWHGLYECRLNRSMEDPVLIWSATVQSVKVASTVESLQQRGLTSTTTEGLPNHTSITVLVVLVTLFLVVTLVLLVTTICYKFRCTHSSKKSFLTTHISSFTNAVFGGSNSTATKTSNLGFAEKGLTTVDNIDPLEFPFDRLTVSDYILGEGTFGCVKQAIAHGIVEDDPNRNIVAVKTCREDLFHQQAYLWQELELMKKLHPHENIVNLLGYSCSPTGRLHLIIEFAMYGNLKDFLVDYQANFSQSVSSPPSPTGTPETPSSESSRCGSSSSFPLAYSALRKKMPLSQQDSVFSMGSEGTTSDSSSTLKDLPMLARGDCPCLVPGYNSRSSSRSGNDCAGDNSGTVTSSISHSCVDSGIGEDANSLLDLDTVLNFALQIAHGLQHLKSLNVVHRDLACRNVLIAENFLLKIADFGMAQEDKCINGHEGKVPVKWSAPEALSDHIFSHNSDIWSYGITLWEIFSYGAKPYGDQNIGLSFDPFIQYLMDGNRLAQPAGCPTIFYHLMKRCWQLKPEERPTAKDLVETLKQMSTISRTDDKLELSERQSGNSCGSSMLP